MMYKVVPFVFATLAVGVSAACENHCAGSKCQSSAKRKGLPGGCWSTLCGRCAGCSDEVEAGIKKHGWMEIVVEPEAGKENVVADTAADEPLDIVALPADEANANQTAGVPTPDLAAFQLNVAYGPLKANDVIVAYQARNDEEKFFIPSDTSAKELTDLLTKEAHSVWVLKREESSTTAHTSSEPKDTARTKTAETGQDQSDSTMTIVIVIVILLVLGGGAYFMMAGGEATEDEEEEETEEEEEA